MEQTAGGNQQVATRLQSRLQSHLQMNQQVTMTPVNINALNFNYILTLWQTLTRKRIRKKVATRL